MMINMKQGLQELVLVIFIDNGDLYGDGNYTVKQVKVGSVHHDAVTTQVWVVDQAAWTETVASGC